MIKKIIPIIGKILIAVAFIFLLIYFYISISDGTISKDIFGFTVPNPPLWTSYIPIVGSVIGFITQFFSTHGLVGVLVTLFLFGIGISLMGSNKSNKNYIPYNMKSPSVADRSVAKLQVKLALLKILKRKLEIRSNLLDNINYDGEDKVILTVLQFLRSSKRQLPARYCNGDFMIPNNPLSASEQYELAGNAVMAMGMVKNKDFAEKVAGGKYKAPILYLGENISLIVALVKKLGGSEENMTEIIDLLHKAARKKYNKNELPQEVIDISEDYFKYCYNFAFNTVNMERENIKKYVAELRESIMKCFLEGFMKHGDGNLWPFACQSVLQNFVLSRPGWEKSIKADDTVLIFRGKYPLSINILTSGSAGMLMIHTATGIAKAELMDDMANTQTEDFITMIVKLVEGEDWIIPFIRKKS